MAEILGFFGDWTWWIIGGLLLVSELVATNIVLVWFGLAALSVGRGRPVSGPELADGNHSVCRAFDRLSGAWTALCQDTRATDEVNLPYLNQRVNAFVGRTTVLHEPIVNGEGKVSMDDALWKVTGTDAPAGSRVRVTGGVRHGAGNRACVTVRSM